MSSELNPLAAIYLLQGEQALLQGNAQGLKLFEKSLEIEPSHPELFYRQGLAIFEYGSTQGREKSLLIGAKKFKAAAYLAPHRSEIWHSWGSLLFLLGETLKESRFFLEAEEKLKKALELNKDKNFVELQYDYAKIWTRIAQYSGEAVDLQKALTLFEKISGDLEPEFWVDYGRACLEMLQLLNDPSLILKGIECFKQAILLSPSAENWRWLACSLKLRFFETHEEDHFNQTDEAFAKASELSPYDVDLRHEWARFLLEAGRLQQDLGKLRLCIEKCQQGYLLDVKHAELCAIWAEALAALGESSDQIDLLYEAQNKITEALHLEEDNLEVLHAEAQVYYSWGVYYDDFDYYFQAIEKFQEVISMDRTRHADWYAMAKAYCSVCDLDSDIDACEKAVRFYAKAIDLKPLSIYYFEYSYALSRLGEMKKDPELIKQSVSYFEYALQMQKNALYLYPDWFYQYAISLDFLGDYEEDEIYYQKALEALMQVLMSQPDFPRVHYRLGLAYCHLGEITSEMSAFQRALHHFRLAHKHDPDCDFVILDWGVTLIHIAQHCTNQEIAVQNYQEAELKLLKSARLGNQNALYQLGCLYSLLEQFDKALQYIHKAHAAQTLPSLDELLEDEWLENLRSTSAFQEFLQHGPSKK